MSEYFPNGGAPKDPKQEAISKSEDSENRISTEYAYILGVEQNTATFFNFDGIRIIEGGLATSDEQYEDTVNEITAIILSAPTLDNLGSTDAFVEKDNRLPVVSHTGLLNKVVKCRSGAMFKKIQEIALKSIVEIPVFNSKYEPYTIYQSVKKGTISLYVLAGTRQEGEMIAKALASEKEEEVNKCAAEYGGVAVLLWRPNSANKPVVRVLLSGTCSSLRIQDSLNKVSKILPFLNAPTVKSADAFKTIPAPTITRIVRNPNAAKPPRPAVTVSRPPATSRASQPPVDRSASSKASMISVKAESARPNSKPSTAPVKAEKPQLPARAPVSRSAPWKVASSGVATKTVPAKAGVSQPRATQANPAVKRAAQPVEQKQPVAAKRPTTKPAVPVFKKSSVPPTKVEEIKPEPSSPERQKVTPTKLGDTIQIDDSTLKSPDQSSRTGTLTVDSADSSVCEVFPIRERSAPVSLGVMNEEVVESGPSLDLKDPSMPVTTGMPAPEGKTKQEKQQLAMADIIDYANNIAKDTIDRSITEGLAGILQNVVIDEKKDDLCEIVTTFTQDISNKLVREAAVEASAKLNEEKPAHGLDGHKLEEETNENSSFAEKKTLSPKANAVIDDIVEDAMSKAIHESLNKTDPQPDAGSTNVFPGSPTATASSFEPPVLRMQTNRRPPPAHKPLKIVRPYYFDLVKMPRDKNSMVAENIQEFVSMIRSKHLVLPTDNISELQLQAVINGHKSGHPCTIIPTHTSDTLTDFLANNQSRLSDIHLSFETPLNKHEAGDIIGIDKRKISFD